MAPKRTSFFTRILQLILDKASALKTEQDAQKALQKATDPKVVKKNLGAVGTAFSGVGKIATGVGATILAAFSARKLMEYADTWKLIQGRLKLVTDGAGSLASVTDKLQGIANRTRSSFEDVATLYQRIALNADQLGRTQEDVLRITETVSKSIQIGGASAEEASAGVRQLSQALASGRLQGDEFRSIMENMPDLARRLSKELGVTIGELRAMSKAGELTADVVTGALLKMSAAVDEDFKDVPVTIGGAFKVLGNNILEFVGQADEGTGASSIFAKGLLALAEGADLAADAFRKLNEARANGGMANSGFFQPGGQGEGGAFFGRQGKPSRPGGDLGQDADAIRAAAAAERALSGTPAARANALVARLESERTEAIVKAKAANAATAAEVAELNELYRQGNAMLLEGNVALEDRAKIASALAKLGFDEAKAKTAEQLNKLEDERIKDLSEAVQLGIATNEETAKLVGLQVTLQALMDTGNLSLEERVRRSQQLKDIEEGILAARERAARGTHRPPTTEQLARDLPLDVFAAERERRRKAFDLRGSTEVLGGPLSAPKITDTITGVSAVTKDELQDLTDTWIDQHAVMLDAAQNAAMGVAGAWQDAFEAVALEGAGVSGFVESLFGGMAGAVLGGLAQIASAKVAENLALAFQALGMGWAQSLVGNVAGPAIGSKSAGFHFAAAAGWAALGGAAGAAQSAAAGGGRGGVSGGVPSGARDPVSRLVNNSDPQRRITINNYIDGIDPRNSVHQTLVGLTQIQYNNRRGTRITDTRRQK